MRNLAVAGMCMLALYGSAASAATLEIEQFLSKNVIPNPIKVEAPKGDPANIYILDRTTGRVTVHDTQTGTSRAEPFMELPPSFQPNSYYNAFSIEFAPDYETSGEVYVSYVDTLDNLQVSVVRRLANDPNKVDPTTFRSIINVKYDPVGPGTHYGADLDFGPDGNLYITTGDNDDSFDQVKSQDATSLQGKVLRINPRADDFGSDPVNNFSVPADNPLRSASPAVTDAIWATGLRNPFQAAFDPVSGRFLIADIGEDRYEEINIGKPGANYGWPVKEGPVFFRPDLGLPGTIYTDPLFTYQSGSGPDERKSITGGIFYTGPLAALSGRYFFADYVANTIWSFDLAPDGESILNLLSWNILTDGGLPSSIVSFGADGNGDMYIVTLDNGIYKVIGASAEDVPLPAALPLLASAIAAFAAASRLRTRRDSSP
jgi:glucose/arabinose dehydrogenase